MKSYRKTNKNSKAVGVALLFSLINILYPQAVVSENELIISKSSPEINSGLEYKGLLETKNAENIKYLPIALEKRPKKTFQLTVTAYSSTPDQTSGNPFITASGERVRDGIIAYNHLPLGTKVRFPEVFPEKNFVIKDRLPEGASTYLADMWVPTREEAKQWGAKILKIEVF